MEERAEPFILAAGESRRADALLPFKACASDTGGLLSACEFTLGAWDSGPVLHSHAAVDEAFFVVSGTLEVQLGENRHQASAGAFIWVPRGTAHTFANAGEDQVHVLALAIPGGIENMFAEQFAHISTAQDGPDPGILSAIGERHGAPTLGPPIRAKNAPPLPN